MMRPGSPCLTTDHKTANQYYPVGPPYIMHADDWRKLAPVWREFAPRVYEQYPYLLAEMYAYCIAAAHNRLPHHMLDSLMVSNTDAGGEGWDFVDGRAAACAKDPALPAPNVLHHCQM